MPGSGGVGGDHGGPHGVHRPLDQQLADVEAGLVQGGHRPIAHRPAEQAPVQPPVLPAEQELGIAPGQIEQAQRHGEQLGQHRGPGRASHSHMKSDDKQQIQRYI